MPRKGKRAAAGLKNAALMPVEPPCEDCDDEPQCEDCEDLAVLAKKKVKAALRLDWADIHALRDKIDRMLAEAKELVKLKNVNKVRRCKVRRSLPRRS